MDGNWANLSLPRNYAGNGSILEQVSADPVRKFKFWITEDGKFGVSAGCEKANGGCKEFKEAFGDNVNKVAKDSSEDGSDQKCKQAPKK